MQKYKIQNTNIKTQYNINTAHTKHKNKIQIQNKKIQQYKHKKTNTKYKLKDAKTQEYTQHNTNIHTYDQTNLLYNNAKEIQHKYIQKCNIHYKHTQATQIQT